MSKQVTFSPTARRMIELLRNRGPMRPKDIAEDLKVSRRTVSKAIKSLSEAGLVKEVPYLDDVRGKIIVLKEKA